MLSRLILMLLVVVAAVPTLQAQPKGQYVRGLSQSAVIDQKKGDAVLKTFRNQRLQGDFLFQFEMTSMPPRRGESKTLSYQGKMWGRWQEGRLASRFLIYPGGESSKRLRRPLPKDPKAYTGFLSYNGDDTKIWKYSPNASSEPFELVDKALFEPLLPGLELSAFDLQMSFIFWPNYTYEGIDPTRRTVHSFLMEPPAHLKQIHPDLDRVRIYIEGRFHALTKVEILNPKGKPLRTLKVRKFKKIDGRYIVKEIDFFDERTRRKTRFKVIDAQFKHGLPETFFSPEDLPNLSQKR